MQICKYMYRINSKQSWPYEYKTKDYSLNVDLPDCQSVSQRSMYVHA